MNWYLFFFLAASESVQEKSVTGLSSSSSSSDGSDPAIRFLATNKIWIIIGVVVALVLIALMQAIVMIVRSRKNKTPPVSTKERLITNSGWKDYSQGNMNYAYESFETEENGVNSRRQGSNGSARPSVPRGSYGKSNGQSNGYHGGTNGHPGHLGQHPGGYGGDTRSLQRPRNVPQTRPDPTGT
nr:uncharacterized protein LOC128706497 [Cherax quadricarinatus]